MGVGWLLLEGVVLGRAASRCPRTERVEKGKPAEGARPRIKEPGTRYREGGPEGGEKRVEGREVPRTINKEEPRTGGGLTRTSSHEGESPLLISSTRATGGSRIAQPERKNRENFLIKQKYSQG